MITGDEDALGVVGLYGCVHGFYEGMDVEQEDGLINLINSNTDLIPLYTQCFVMGKANRYDESHVTIILSTCY